MGLADVSNAKYNISTQYKKHLRWVLHPADPNDDQQWASQHNMPPLQDEFDIPAPPLGMDAATALWYGTLARLLPHPPKTKQWPTRLQKMP